MIANSLQIIFRITSNHNLTKNTLFTESATEKPHTEAADNETNIQQTMATVTMPDNDKTTVTPTTKPSTTGLLETTKENPGTSEEL